MKFYSAIKNNGVLPFIAMLMDEPREHYAQWNKWEKDKCCMLLLICGI